MLKKKSSAQYFPFVRAGMKCSVVEVALKPCDDVTLTQNVFRGMI